MKGQDTVMKHEAAIAYFHTLRPHEAAGFIFECMGLFVAKSIGDEERVHLFLLDNEPLAMRVADTLRGASFPQTMAALSRVVHSIVDVLERSGRQEGR